jgi:hypothetical protein
MIARMYSLTYYLLRNELQDLSLVLAALAAEIEALIGSETKPADGA